MVRFTGKKYVSKGINERLPAVLVVYLFQLIDEKKKLSMPMDYLQIFDLKSQGASMLSVTHRQEEPGYVKKHLLSYDLIIEDKIYVIDDGSHTTMMWADEY